MLLVISPAKSLNFDAIISTKNFTKPLFVEEGRVIINELKKFSSQEIAKLMKISDNLAQLNYQRFQDFHTPFTATNAKPAIFVFDGDVYDGIDVENYSEENLNFAQKHLRILSGLYGVLRPLDLMQAYRLEMSTSLKVNASKNLYQFWQEKITDYFNKELTKSADQTLINLASEEYFAAITTAKLQAKIINIIFKEKKSGDYKIIGIFAKKARGLMVNFVIQNSIVNSEEVKKFNISGYKFRAEFSDDTNWHFYRDLTQHPSP